MFSSIQVVFYARRRIGGIVCNAHSEVRGAPPRNTGNLFYSRCQYQLAARPSSWSLEHTFATKSSGPISFAPSGTVISLNRRGTAGPSLSVHTEHSCLKFVTSAKSAVRDHVLLYEVIICSRAQSASFCICFLSDSSGLSAPGHVRNASAWIGSKRAASGNPFKESAGRHTQSQTWSEKTESLVYFE